MISEGDNRVSEKDDKFMDDPLSDTSSDTELSESDICTSFSDSDNEIPKTNLMAEDLSEEITNIRSPSHDTELASQDNISLEVDEFPEKSLSSDTPEEDLRLESVDFSADESEPEVSSTVDEMLSDTSSKSEVPKVTTIDAVPLDDGTSTSTSVDLEICPELASNETVAQGVPSEETIAQEEPTEEAVIQDVLSEEIVAPKAPEVVTDQEPAPVELPVIPVDDLVVISENISEDLDVVPKEPVRPIISETVEETTVVKLPDADFSAPDVPTQELPIPEVPVESTIEQKHDLSSPGLQAAVVDVNRISSDTKTTVGEVQSIDTAEEPTSESETASPLISTVSDVQSSETAHDIAVELEDSIDKTSTFEETSVQMEPVGDVVADVVLDTMENVVDESTAVEGYWSMCTVQYDKICMRFQLSFFVLFSCSILILSSNHNVFSLTIVNTMI